MALVQAGGIDPAMTADSQESIRDEKLRDWLKDKLASLAQRDMPASSMTSKVQALQKAAKALDKAASSALELQESFSRPGNGPVDQLLQTAERLRDIRERQDPLERISNQVEKLGQRVAQVTSGRKGEPTETPTSVELRESVDAEEFARRVRRGW